MAWVPCNSNRSPPGTVCRPSADSAVREDDTKLVRDAWFRRVSIQIDHFSPPTRWHTSPQAYEPSSLQNQNRGDSKSVNIFPCITTWCRFRCGLLPKRTKTNSCVLLFTRTNIIWTCSYTSDQNICGHDAVVVIRVEMFVAFQGSTIWWKKKKTISTWSLHHRYWD